MSLPFVSIIIPTYNRSLMLKLTLDSFIAQDYGVANFEIIVSNNNSTDDTQSLIDEYVEKYKNLSTIFVNRQGVHYARNEASLMAKGEILYFTDDDMVADISLLTNLIKVFEYDQRIGTVTGMVIPRFEQEPPKWIASDLINAWLSLTDKNRKESLIISPEDIGVYSCHQAIKREVFFEAGGFNPENTAGVWIGDGETGLNIKIKKNGHYFAYTAESMIEHIIPPKRTTLKYLINRIGNEGFCAAYTEFKGYKDKNLLLKNILYGNWIRFFKIEVKCFILLLLGRSNFRFLFAYPFYFLSKSRYEIKLLRDQNFRRLVQIDDWIENIEQTIEFKQGTK